MRLFLALTGLFLLGPAVATTLDKVHYVMSGTTVDYRACCEDPGDALTGKDWSLRFEIDQTPIYSETNYPGSLGYNHQDVYSYNAIFMLDGQTQYFSGDVKLSFSWSWCYDDWCSFYDAEFRDGPADAYQGELGIDLNVDGFDLSTIKLWDISMPRPDAYPERYTFDTTATAFLNLNDPGVYVPRAGGDLWLEGMRSGAVTLGLDNRYAYVGASVVPIPAAVWLFGSALVGLGWLRRRPS